MAVAKKSRTSLRIEKQASFEQNILFHCFQLYKPSSNCEIYVWKNIAK